MYQSRVQRRRGTEAASVVRWTFDIALNRKHLIAQLTSGKHAKGRYSSNYCGSMLHVIS